MNERTFKKYTTKSDAKHAPDYATSVLNRLGVSDIEFVVKSDDTFYQAFFYLNGQPIAEEWTIPNKDEYLKNMQVHDFIMETTAAIL